MVVRWEVNGAKTPGSHLGEIARHGFRLPIVDNRDIGEKPVATARDRLDEGGFSA